MIPNKQSKRYIVGACKSSVICSKLLKELSPEDNNVITNNVITNNIIPTYKKKFIKPIIIAPSIEDIFSKKLNRNFQPVPDFEIYQSLGKEIEGNFFLSRDVNNEDNFNLVCIGGGGNGGGSTHDENNPATNGGGAGGNIIRINNMIGKKNDMITIYSGKGGYIERDKVGEAGRDSYIKYYRFSNTFDPNNIVNHYWFCIAKGGGGGGKDSAGTNLNNEFYGIGPGTVVDVKGGSGGDDRDGMYSYDVRTPDSQFYFTNTGVWPSELYNSASGGGGGGTADKNEVSYKGGWCGSYNGVDTPGVGGKRGEQLPPDADWSYPGMSGTIWGSGGGAGGVWYNTGSIESELGYTPVKCYSGGNGGPGNVIVYYQKTRTSTNPFVTTAYGETENCTYVIVPYIIDQATKKPYVTEISFNVTTKVNYILIGGGGSGGRGTHDESNGGGGGGGTAYGTINLNSSDKVFVSVGPGGQINRDLVENYPGTNSVMYINSSTNDNVIAYGGQAGTIGARGLGGGASLIKGTSSTNQITMVSITGAAGGDQKAGDSSSVAIPDSALNIELQKLTPLILKKNCSGGGSGKGSHDDKDYSGGYSGSLNGVGGLAVGHGVASEGYISNGIGCGGGGGGWDKDGSKGYFGAPGCSGLFIAWYLKM